jgi:hypothetical protein
MTVEEMDAEIAHMDAHLERLRVDTIAGLNELIAETKDPVIRGMFEKKLEEVQARGNGRYD